jgi:hypothetical protein
MSDAPASGGAISRPAGIKVRETIEHVDQAGKHTAFSCVNRDP